LCVKRGNCDAGEKNARRRYCPSRGGVTMAPGAGDGPALPSAGAAAAVAPGGAAGGGVASGIAGGVTGGVANGIVDGDAAGAGASLPVLAASGGSGAGVSLPLWRLRPFDGPALAASATVPSKPSPDYT
jgi:hypothetical protein